MGKLVATEFLSLDGVYEDPGGAEKTPIAGWTFKFDRGQEGDRYKLDELMAADAQLLGRITYEGFARAWPRMTNVGDFGVKMNSMPKHVVSTTIREASWNNSAIIRDSVPDEVRRLKDRYPGGILIAGSGILVRSLMAADLIDEFHLMVFPVVLGWGKRLWDGAPPVTLRLTDVRTVGPDGVSIQTYVRASERVAAR
jgi:dihydrofolate reductase